MANLACAQGEQSLARSPAVAPAQLETLSWSHGLVGNVVPCAQCSCLCRQPLASSVTLVSVLPRAGGPRAGRRRRSHLEPGDLVPDSEARGRGWRSKTVLHRPRGAWSRRCAAHAGSRPQDTLTETPARSLPYPGVIRARVLASSTWPSSPGLVRSVNSWETSSRKPGRAQDQSPGFLAIVCTAAGDPPSDWGI